MEIIIITLASKDAAILDVTLAKTLALFPAEKTSVKIISSIPGPDGRLHRRNITVNGFSREQTEVLQKLDIPDNVSALIRVEA